MSNEELEKRMEFIIEHQAQFAANIQAHDERLTRLEQQIGQIGGQIGQIGGQIGQIGEYVGQLEDIVNRLAAATLAGFKDVNAKIDALVDSHIRLSEAQSRLSEAQTRTEESLKNLIAVVDRYLSERRNGEQK